MKNCPKKWENCKICNKKWSLWEYVTGVSFKRSMTYVKWDELKFLGFSLLIAYVFLGWIGVILTFIFLKNLANVQGGPQLYTSTKSKILYRGDCYLGHKDCIYKARVVY